MIKLHDPIWRVATAGEEDHRTQRRWENETPDLGLVVQEEAR